jgi:hypothetical protein
MVFRDLGLRNIREIDVSANLYLEPEDLYVFIVERDQPLTREELNAWLNQRFTLTISAWGIDRHGDEERKVIFTESPMLGMRGREGPDVAIRSASRGIDVIESFNYSETD